MANNIQNLFSYLRFFDNAPEPTNAQNKRILDFLEEAQRGLDFVNTREPGRAFYYAHDKVQELNQMIGRQKAYYPPTTQLILNKMRITLNTSDVFREYAETLQLQIDAKKAGISTTII